MEISSTGLTTELLQRVLRDGRHWLTQLAEEGQLSSELRPLRRLTWHLLLGVVSSDKPEQWAEELGRHRERYSGHVEDLKRETDVKAVDVKFSNPLSRHVSNPFLKLQANEQLLAEIWKDIERTFPENEILSTPESRNAMQNILFHWCRVNNPADAAADSYRQGMNELIGVVWSVVRQGEYVEETSADHHGLGVSLCGRRHNEADAFALFDRLMQAGLRPMFVVSGASLAASRPTKSPVGELPRSRVLAHPGGEVPGPSSPILARCNFIGNVALKHFDEKLHKHLQRMEIEPQVFLLRWLRLLFCREFCLEQTVLLWDALFADSLQPPPPAALKYPPAKGGPPFVAVMNEASAASAALPLVDYVAVALLCSFRGDLLTSDQTDCLRRLMSGPGMQQGGDAQELIEVAKRLRESGKPLIAEPESFTMADGDSDDPDAEELMTATTSAEDDLLPHQANSTAAAHAAPQLGATMRTARAEVPREIPPQAQQLFNAAAQQAQGLFDAGRQALALAGQKVQTLKPPQGFVGEGAGSSKRGSAGQADLAAAASRPPSAATEASSLSGRSQGDDVGRTGDAASADAFPGGMTSSTTSSADAAKEMAELRRRVAAAELERDTIKRKANEFYLMKKAEWAAQIKAVQSQLAARDMRIADLEQQVAAGQAEAVKQQQRISAVERELAMAKEPVAATPSAELPTADSAKADEEF
mmetsp:Transcript_75361/g.125182  ORF Transcript_75361/g.125182 Transcript_75361/m.125182 type:complete len:703 (-) Transcript_75361:37-2145(-)